MSEVDLKDFVCEYSREKYEMEFLFQSYKTSKETVVIFQISIRFCLKNQMLINSLYWNIHILLSTVTKLGGDDDDGDGELFYGMVDQRMAFSLISNHIFKRSSPSRIPTCREQDKYKFINIIFLRSRFSIF